MKKLLAFLLFSLSSTCFAAPFSDPTTGLFFEIPEGFDLNEEESGVDEVSASWWYVFSDSSQGTLVVEIDQYDHLKSLPEHFHLALTKDDDELDGVISEGMEFKNFDCGGMEFTKCKLRILAISHQLFEPLFVCDYLFVKDHFGFSISLMKKENEIVSNEESEAMLLTLLQSINFNK